MKNKIKIISAVFALIIILTVSINAIETATVINPDTILDDYNGITVRMNQGLNLSNIQNDTFNIEFINQNIHYSYMRVSRDIVNGVLDSLMLEYGYKYLDPSDNTWYYSWTPVYDEIGSNPQNYWFDNKDRDIKIISITSTTALNFIRGRVSLINTTVQYTPANEITTPDITAIENAINPNNYNIQWQNLIPSQYSIILSNIGKITILGTIYNSIVLSTPIQDLMIPLFFFGFVAFTLRMIKRIHIDGYVNKNENKQNRSNKKYKTVKTE